MIVMEIVPSLDHGNSVHTLGNISLSNHLCTDVDGVMQPYCCQVMWNVTVPAHVPVIVAGPAARIHAGNRVRNAAAGHDGRCSAGSILWDPC